MLRGTLAQNAADTVIDRGIGAVVLAIHLKVHTQGRPARTKVWLPLQLHVPARHRKGHFFALFRVKSDRALFGIHLFHRHIHDPPCLGVDRQENRISLAALFTQRLEHHSHDLVILLGCTQQYLVKLTRGIKFGRRDKLILKPEGIKEAAQHRVVMRAKTVKFFKRIRDARERLLQMLRQRFWVWDVARHFAHPVKIVRKTDKLARQIADHTKGVADHARACHFAKGSDVRQA